MQRPRPSVECTLSTAAELIPPVLWIAGFVMPCHSTPYHASLHRSDARLRFLDCSPPPPPLTGAAEAPGRVEEDVEAASDAGAAGMAAAATAAPHGFPPQWGPPVWSGTPIRDTSCRCQPLTGVPYLRPGPRPPSLGMNRVVTAYSCNPYG